MVARLFAMQCCRSGGLKDGAPVAKCKNKDKAFNDTKSLEQQATQHSRHEGGQERTRRITTSREMHTIDLTFDTPTAEQWAEWSFFTAARRLSVGKRGLAQKLLGAGPEIGDALHVAVRDRHGEIVNNLVGSGESIVAKDTNWCTPLHIAAYRDNGDVQLLLLEGLVQRLLTTESARRCTSQPVRITWLRTSSRGCWQGRQPSMRPA